MIGTALVEVAIKEAVEVYAIVRPNTTRIDRLPRSPLVRILYSNLQSIKDIKEIPNDCDVLYHLAWDGTSKQTRDDPRIHERNIKYTLDAVDLAKSIGCKRFVFAGSQAEYGPVEGKIDENTRYAPALAYGIGKYAAGILSKKLCEEKGIEHVWGRIFSVYGPHDNENTMLDYAVQCFLRGETAHFSASTQIWNYLYETDAGEMFYRLGFSNVPQGVYLIAGDESIPLKEYISTMMRVYDDGAKADFAVNDSHRCPGLDVNVDKTVRVLQYHPKISFEDGIRYMIECKKAEMFGEIRN